LAGSDSAGSESSLATLPIGGLFRACALITSKPEVTCFEWGPGFVRTEWGWLRKHCAVHRTPIRHIEWHFVWDDIKRIRRERCFDGDFCFAA